VREFIRLLTLPCEEIAKLVSTSLDGDLAWTHRFAIKSHLLYCKACRRYRRQILLLRQTLHAWGARMDEVEPPPGQSLPPEARERIRRSLAQE
jgi:predicted anti-sigma-YlaC factor YlaD